MNSYKVLAGVLTVALVLESALFASIYLGRTTQTNQVQHVLVPQKTFALPFDEFNQPISNDTEYMLDSELNGSWALSIRSDLVPSANNMRGSEAQIAIAPKYPTENLSIPTIIVQERGDGLLRIEYFAQNWNNSYGLILYNSTFPTWTSGENVTLNFRSFGPPAPVNPQVAPFPNGNLTITVGTEVVLSNYPIPWAGLYAFYVYGLRGSTFAAGAVTLAVYEVRSGA
ncbi:MAG TPA: hypothetical protein VEG61_01005 [Candidatus Dormibacteraeota bacterium]|nr:hypothetical protein [Candidatus Dormibacteraeota bacterium]